MQAKVAASIVMCETQDSAGDLHRAGPSGPSSLLQILDSLSCVKEVLSKHSQNILGKEQRNDEVAYE